MNNYDDGIFFGIMTSICFFGFVFIIFNLVVQYSWEKEAIQHNAAHYDAQTGEFTWNLQPKE